MKLNRPDFRAWIRANMRCATCNAPDPHPHHEPSKRHGGDDTRLIGLCFDCHYERHHVLGYEKFWAKYQLDPASLALHTLRMWLMQGHVEPVKAPVRTRKAEKKPKVSKFQTPLQVRDYMKEANA